MKLTYRETNQPVEGEILKVEERDYREIKKSGQFEFDWSEEKDYQVFKLINAHSEEILGLVSIIDYPEELRIHINLIENSINNQGEKKNIEGVAGCLLSWAIKISFEKGYEGFTSLVPKTRLINHYVNYYGFSQFGRQLAIERREAFDLRQKYLG